MTAITIDQLGSRDGNHNMLRILTKQNLGLNICHINAQSLYRKIDEFRYLFGDSDFDAICISETWFTDAHNDKLVELMNYQLFRCDRRGNGGGVAIYIKNNISCKLLQTFSAENDVEYILVELNSFGEKLLLGCVYRPSNNIRLDSIVAKLEQVSVAYTNIIISGDFNANLLSSSGSNLSTVMTSLNLFSVNSVRPTHFTATNATLLDLFLVADNSKIVHYDQLAAPVFSKHDLIFLCYKFKVARQVHTFTFRDYNNINMSSLQEDLTHANWDEIYYFPSVSEQVEYLNGLILPIFNKHVPLKIKNTNGRISPWFTTETKLLIERRDILYKQWKRYRTQELLHHYRLARRAVVFKIRHDKLNYYGNKFQTAVNTKQKWKQIREIGIVGTRANEGMIDVNALNKKFTNIPQPPVQLDFYGDNVSIDPVNQFSFQCFNLDDTAEGFLAVKSNAVGLDDIQPRFIKLILPWIIRHVNHIFNTAVTTSTFPSGWKCAKIIPVPKDDKEYRPISILPYLSKVFERLLHKQISKHIFDNNLLTDRQSGFRPQHSCTTALTEVIENIRGSLDDNKVAILILLDHSKAFDTVEHQMLIKKLAKMFNFSETATKLVASYLGGRSQIVANNGTFSRPLITLRGVPQGSILGPLLYSLYANDLPLQIKYSFIQMFADDVQLYMSCTRTSIRPVENKLNHDLDMIYKWACANGLRLNPNKSKCLIIGAKSTTENINNINVNLNGTRIELVHAAKNLGVTFNRTLTWSDHINQVCGRTYAMLRSLWCSQHFTPLRIRMMLAKSYLIPTFLYCCEVFAACNATDKRKLVTTFNNITRYIFDLQRFDHVSPYSKRIFGMTFDNYLKLKRLIFLHKIIVTKEPKYLYNKLTFTSSLRNNSIRTFKFRKSASYNQFYISTIYLWNHLPTDIQLTSNAIKFKKLLTSYFINN